MPYLAVLAVEWMAAVYAKLVVGSNKAVSIVISSGIMTEECHNVLVSADCILHSAAFPDPRTGNCCLVLSAD